MNCFVSLLRRLMTSLSSEWTHYFYACVFARCAAGGSSMNGPSSVDPWRRTEAGGDCEQLIEGAPTPSFHHAHTQAKTLSPRLRWRDSSLSKQQKTKELSCFTGTHASAVCRRRWHYPPPSAPRVRAPTMNNGPLWITLSPGFSRGASDRCLCVERSPGADDRQPPLFPSAPSPIPELCSRLAQLLPHVAQKNSVLVSPNKGFRLREGKLRVKPGLTRLHNCGKCCCFFFVVAQNKLHFVVTLI